MVFCAAACTVNVSVAVVRVAAAVVTKSRFIESSLLGAERLKAASELDASSSPAVVSRANHPDRRGIAPEKVGTLGHNAGPLLAHPKKQQVLCFGVGSPIQSSCRASC